MPTTGTYALTVTASETISTSVPAISASANSVNHTLYSTAKSLTATGSSTQPALTKVAYFSKAMSAGAATIDLTALTGTNGASVTMSGLKICLLRFRNPSTNTGAITIAKGASNGFGTTTSGTTFTVTLPPDSEFGIFLNEGTPDVAGAAKTIDISGTGTEALECVVWGG
jgi:hypothetical protein